MSTVSAGAVFTVPYPYIREEVDLPPEGPEDGPVTAITWRPGVRWVGPPGMHVWCLDGQYVNALPHAGCAYFRAWAMVPANAVEPETEKPPTPVKERAVRIRGNLIRETRLRAVGQRSGSALAVLAGDLHELERGIAEGVSAQGERRQFGAA